MSLSSDRYFSLLLLWTGLLAQFTMEVYLRVTALSRACGS